MSRKDFEKIAETIRECRWVFCEDEAATAVLDRVTSELSRALSGEASGRFDHDRFERACQLPVRA